MSSSAATAPSVNGSNVNGSANASANSTPSSARTLRMNSTAGKGADGARRQAGSPLEGGQRKPPAQKAWTQGTNPITQRPSNPTSANGTANAPKPAPTPYNAAPVSSETGSPKHHLSDRMMFLLAQMTGHVGSITLKNGEKYTGVLSGTSLDPTELRYVFKMVKRVPSTEINGNADTNDDYIGHGESHVMSFDVGDVADFHVADVVFDKAAKTQNGASTAFRTDTDISGNLAIRERNLQRWEPSADVDANLSLESSGRSDWDQFSTNERLFGVQSSYDESYYTTTIDRSNPQYAEKAARAERLAREIESSSALNSHVREERGQASADDKGDEEEKYSGVRRDFPPLPSGQANKYTPPARRPPTGQPTVHGAPVDPAIISSQLAKPAQATVSPPAEKRAPQDAAPVDAAPQAEPQKTETAKETPAAPEAKPAPVTKPAAEPGQKPSNTLKPAAAGIPARQPGRPDDATSNVEQNLLASFRDFSASEKLRISDRQRAIHRESKAVKLNDLKKFSQMFKLHTPVPTDLVPILAKDSEKQQAIVDKANKAAAEAKSTPPKASPVSVEPKTTKTIPAKPDATPTAPVDRQQNQRPRPGPNNYNSASMREPSARGQNMHQGPRNAGLLSTRLALNQQQHKQGGPPFNAVPQPIPVQDMRIPPPSGPSSGAQTPASAASSRFNVRAPDFKPNPAAITFQPGGDPSTQSSPRPESAARQEPPRKVQISSFFGGHKPESKPLDLDEAYNPIKNTLQEFKVNLEKDKSKAREREFTNNSGMPYAFKTPPTWDFPEANTGKTYVDMFERPSAPGPAAHGAINNHVPHQHQLPQHLQQGPPHVQQGPTPHHTPRGPPVQPHHGPGGHHFEGHMPYSQPGQIYPSPRPVPHQMYSGQPQAMPGFPQQVPMQPYGMSPGVQHVALRGAAGAPQFVNGPGPAMGGQMMTNNPSNGPYMTMPGNGQMPMYSPAPGPAYPHYPGQMPTAPGQNNFPSPRPGGAQMMQHQGSQQGHQPQPLMYVQHAGQVPPMFAQMAGGPMPQMRGPYPQPHQQQFNSPHQHHPFPHQPHRGTPSGSYAQPMMQQHSMPPQGPPPPTGPASHTQEGGEEVK